MTLDEINKLISAKDNKTTFSLPETNDAYVTKLDRSLSGANLTWCGQGQNTPDNLAYNAYRLNIWTNE